MKKRQLEALRLNKEIISKIRQIEINGGKLELKTIDSKGNYCTQECSGGCSGVGSCNQ